MKSFRVAVHSTIAHSSANNCVSTLVTGVLSIGEQSARPFAQAFVLAPCGPAPTDGSEQIYYVRNDMLRLLPSDPSSLSAKTVSPAQPAKQQQQQRKSQKKRQEQSEAAAPVAESAPVSQPPAPVAASTSNGSI